MAEDKEDIDVEVLSNLRSDLAAGHTIASMREAGWGPWIDHLEEAGYDIRAEVEVLSNLRSDFAAGHTIESMREAGWGPWIDHLEGAGYDIRAEVEILSNGRAPYSVRHVSGLPNVDSGQAVTMKIDEDAILIWHAVAGLNQRIPLESLRSARIDTAQRIVAMRVITTGIFGLLWKKKDKFLVLEWDDPSGMNVPVILSFNAADQALSEIQVAKAARRQQSQKLEDPTLHPPTQSVPDRIHQAKKLFEDGVISEADYEAKKDKLLGEL